MYHVRTSYSVPSSYGVTDLITGQPIVQNLPKFRKHNSIAVCEIAGIKETGHDQNGNRVLFEL